MNSLVIDGFQVEQYPLGRGCSGEVYRAWHLSGQQGQQEYAVKRYNSMAIDRRFMEQMHKRLKELPAHQGIIPIAEYRFHQPPYYSISKFDDGTKLSSIRRLSESDTWKVIFKLAEAMAHAHKHRLVHGNLHPGNIFYDKKQDGGISIRIGDFASGMIGNVHHIDLGESAYFAAPEQLQCLGSDYESGNAEKWDIYHFGAIAYWLINQNTCPRGLGYRESRARALAESGGRPVPLNPLALASFMEGEKPLCWSTAETPYHKMLEGCLAMNPADRPIDMREVESEFLALQKTSEPCESTQVEIPPLEVKPSVSTSSKTLPETTPVPEKANKKKLTNWFRSGGSLHNPS